MEKKSRRQYRRRYSGFCGESVLETEGQEEWATMDDFCEYLRCWQGKRNIELVYWDSKKSKAYNDSNKFERHNPNYVPEALSTFAYKAWVCALGKRGATNPCKFMVRARYHPTRKKVICKVLRHRGPGALPNGHNHPIDDFGARSISVGRQSDAEKDVTGEKIIEKDVQNVLGSMEKDPAKAASLVARWSSAKRRRLCKASLDKFAAVISREEFCHSRRMIEVLNVVEFMGNAIERTGNTRRKESGDSSCSINGSLKAEAENSILQVDMPSPPLRSGEKFAKDSPRAESSLSSADELKELDNFCEALKKSNETQADAGPKERGSFSSSLGGITRSCIVGRVIDGEDVPPSRFLDRTTLSVKMDSVGALAERLKQGASLGELTARMGRFPQILSQKLRVTKLYELKESVHMPLEDIFFLIDAGMLDKLITRILSFRNLAQKADKVQKIGINQKSHVVELLDEDDGTENYGVRLQVYEKQGRKVIECSSLTLSLSSLLGMRKVQNALELVEESKKFMDWVVSVDCTLETVEEWSKLENIQQHIKRTLPLLKATDFQGGRPKSGFAYCLASLFRLRGASPDCKGLWLNSDAIQMAILMIRRDLQKELGSTVFILPPLLWDSDSATVVPWRELSSKKRQLGKDFGKEEAKNFVRILKQQNDPIVNAASNNLARAVVYTVVNKSGNHWVGLEACVRTKSVLLYDPADTLGPREGAGSEKYFSRVRLVLDCLLEMLDVPPPPLKYNEWKTGWTYGGQQIASWDWVNCGVYAVEWVKFRVHSAVEHREMIEKKERAVFLREKLRDTRMPSFDIHYLDKIRMRIAEFSLREICKIQSTMKKNEVKAAKDD